MSKTPGTLSSIGRSLAWPCLAPYVTREAKPGGGGPRPAGVYIGRGMGRLSVARLAFAGWPSLEGTNTGEMGSVGLHNIVPAGPPPARRLRGAGNKIASTNFAENCSSARRLKQFCSFPNASARRWLALSRRCAIVHCDPLVVSTLEDLPWTQATLKTATFAPAG